MPYIYSTLSADTKYTLYEKNAQGDLVIPIRGVVIKGGANVASKSFVTPQGVVTEVTDEELTFLQENSIFQAHLDGGFLRIDNKKIEIEKAVKSLEKGDKSKPLTHGDYPEDARTKVGPIGAIPGHI